MLFRGDGDLAGGRADSAACNPYGECTPWDFTHRALSIVRCAPTRRELHVHAHARAGPGLLSHAPWCLAPHAGSWAPRVRNRGVCAES